VPYFTAQLDKFFCVLYNIGMAIITEVKAQGGVVEFVSKKLDISASPDSFGWIVEYNKPFDFLNKRFQFLKSVERSGSGSHKRGFIVSYSPRSALRLSHVLQRYGFAMDWFLTLTYPAEFVKDRNMRRYKRDLDAFLKRLRRYDKNVLYIWVLEFQLREAPHFHLLLKFSSTFSPEHFRKWVSRAWFEVVSSGDVKHYRAGTNFERIRSKRLVKSYVKKYLSKGGYQKQVPLWVLNLGRWWGYTRQLSRVVLSVSYDFRAVSLEVLIKVRRVFRKMLKRKVYYKVYYIDNAVEVLKRLIGYFLYYDKLKLGGVYV